MTANILFPQWSTAVDGLHTTAQAESEAAQAILERNEKSGKMTEAARRKKLYADLIATLKSDDDSASKLQTIQDLLSANPTVGLNERGWEEIAQNAVEHFDRTCCEFLYSKGLRFPGYMFGERLFKRFDPEMFEYLMTLAIATQNDPQEPYAHVISGLYGNVLQKFLDPKPSVRATSRMVRQRLEQEFPKHTKNVLGQSHRYYGSWHIMLNTLLLKYPTDLPAEDLTFIRTIPLEVFDWPFGNLYTAHTTNARELESFNRFLGDFPLIAQEWKKFEDKKSADVVKWRKFWSQMLPHGLMEFKTSPLRAKVVDLLSTERRITIALPRLHLNVDNDDQQQLDMFRISATKNLDDRLGFDLYDRVSLYSENVSLYGGHFSSNFASPDHSTGTLLETIILKGATALESLVNDDDGLRVLDENLSNKQTLMRFCAHANLTVVNKYLKARPQWLEWKDQTGNTFGHYIAALRSEKSKNLATQLARWNHEWLSVENDNGVSVRDIFDDAEADESVLAVISKESMKRLMKSQGIAKEKVNARNASQPKRRM